MGSRTRLLLAALLVLAAVAAFGTRASASSLIRPPAGTPDPKQMVLATSDLRSAKVTKQGYYKDTDFPSVISYSREFEDAVYGGTRFLDLDSEAEIGTSVASTAGFLANLRTLVGTKAFRRQVTKEFTKEFGDSFGLASDPRVGRPRKLGLGPSSFDLPISFRVFGLRTELHISAFRQERVLGGLVTVGAPGRRIALTTLTRLAKTMAARMVEQLGPKNTTPPTITGKAQVGQTLTATPGTWSGSSTGFSYQWQRCDTAGANCAAIPGASGQTYVLADADAGSTVRVAVTARTASGSATAISAPTAPVAAAGAPSNTALPAITGTAQVGQTLSATTGAWNGAPTSFSFQWRRCTADGSGCADVPGATAGTYVVAAADRGSTIRVAVTATNTAGSMQAVSLPTAVVP